MARPLILYETPFGLRTIKFTADNGFLLNGERVPLNGVCDHHDLGALGSALNTRALERQLELLKEMGCNAIRTSHNPPAPELLELCDRMGFVVMDEAFDCWVRGKTRNDYHLLFPDWHEKDLRALVRRDRNHPCVILWSIGNEISEQGSPAGHKVAGELAAIVRSEDPTRPVTAGCNLTAAGYNGFQKEVDVFGYNYKPGEYGKFRQANPSSAAVRQRDRVLHQFARRVFLPRQQQPEPGAREFPGELLRPLPPRPGRRRPIPSSAGRTSFRLWPANLSGRGGIIWASRRPTTQTAASCSTSRTPRRRHG